MRRKGRERENEEGVKGLLKVKGEDEGSWWIIYWKAENLKGNDKEKEHGVEK